MRVAVVTAVRAETRAVLASLRATRRLRAAQRWEGRVGATEVTVVECGVGAVAAARAIDAAPLDVDLIVSAGFAGGLDPALVPGDVVIPPRIVWEDADAGAVAYEVPATVHRAAVAAMPADLRVYADGPMVSSPVIITTPAAKREAARRHAAIAVEMEACALATWARRRAVPFVMVRTVLDGADVSLEGLPAGINERWSARASLVLMPATWPLLLTLRAHLGTASRALQIAIAALLVAPVAPRDVAPR